MKWCGHLSHYLFITLHYLLLESIIVIIRLSNKGNLVLVTTNSVMNHPGLEPNSLTPCTLQNIHNIYRTDWTVGCRKWVASNSLLFTGHHYPGKQPASLVQVQCFSLTADPTVSRLYCRISECCPAAEPIANKSHWQVLILYFLYVTMGQTKLEVHHPSGHLLVLRKRNQRGLPLDVDMKVNKPLFFCCCFFYWRLANQLKGALPPPTGLDMARQGIEWSDR